MLRSDIEAHRLWALIDEVEAQLGSLTEPLTEEMAPIALLRGYLSNIRSMRQMAEENPFQVSPAMLEQVWQPIENARAQVVARVANGFNIAYLTNAVAAAEGALMPLGSWPRPFAQGGQVRQMRTLIEDLLETQRLGIEEIRRAHDGLLESAASVLQQSGQRRTEILAELEELRADADAVARTVNDQKVRIDEVVQSGLSSIDAMRTRDAETIAKFREEEAERFDEEFDPYQDRLKSELEVATAEIAEFRKQHQAFENMSSAAASKTMAGKFWWEALFGRVTGILFYLLGFTAIVIAAIPFATLLTDTTLDTNGEIEWGRIIIRGALGVLLASAAAVVIRLGGRFLTQAAAAKRMERRPVVWTRVRDGR